MASKIDIGPAVLEDVRPDLVIARFKDGSVAEASSFEVSMSARREHFYSTPHVVLVIAPDDVEFKMNMLDKDHYKDQGVDTFTRGVGVVSTNTSFTRIIELYYAMHPVSFPVKVFSREEDGLRWADAVLAAGKGSLGASPSATRS